MFEEGVYQPLGPIGAKFKATDQECSRFLISVRKKVGHAPCRNRIKRLLREAIRQERNQLKKSYDICFFVTRTPLQPLDLAYTQRQVRRIFKQINSLSGNHQNR